MKEAKELDWFPVYIHRVKGSDCWKWLPHHFGWYWRLIIEAADSERPGYLPNDLVRLCELANGWGSQSSSRPRNWQETKAKFDSAWGQVLRHKFLTTGDHLWIYNERSLETVEQQTKRLRKRRASLSPDGSDVDVKKSKATALPEMFQVTPEHRYWALENEMPKPDDHIAEFRDYYLGNGKTQKNWDATFRNWLRKAITFRGTNNGKPTKKSNLDKVFGTDSEGMDDGDGRKTPGEQACPVSPRANGVRAQVAGEARGDRREGLLGDDESRYHGMSLLPDADVE